MIEIGKSKGAKRSGTLEKGKKVIPDGNILFSKKAYMFLASHCNAYYSDAEGYQVWD